MEQKAVQHHLELFLEKTNIKMCKYQITTTQNNLIFF